MTTGRFRSRRRRAGAASARDPPTSTERSPDPAPPRLFYAYPPAPSTRDRAAVWSASRTVSARPPGRRRRRRNRRPRFSRARVSPFSYPTRRARREASRAPSPPPERALSPTVSPRRTTPEPKKRAPPRSPSSYSSSLLAWKKRVTRARVRTRRGSPRASLFLLGGGRSTASPGTGTDEACRTSRSRGSERTARRKPRWRPRRAPREAKPRAARRPSRGPSMCRPRDSRSSRSPVGRRTTATR
mmetsp:Transcript_11704/g.49073  ORF Transcript_11704/g.49073 Transcript_11704/m.49073 type:complete len:243 (+) Transcript_11704:1260-1988(+)